ncbi:MAG: hypothetical protein ACK40X_13565, partial [Armatimonadota bacterium]
IAEVEKSEVREGDLLFVPIALFGKEKPYEVITSTRLGSYWNLMIPYVLGSYILGSCSERTRSILNYIHNRGGVFCGLTRFHQHSGLFANEDAVDDLYGLRYALSLLWCDEVERFLVTFYGKLAHGLTRDTYIGAEGTGLIPLDEFGRAMYLPPNSASNAFFLQMLRHLLVQELDTDDDGVADTLRLLFATPRHWMEDGGQIELKNLPTHFGEISLKARSELKKGTITVVVELPTQQTPHRTLLRLRVPRQYRIQTATIGKSTLPRIDDETLDISGYQGRIVIRCTCEELRS